VFAHVYFLLIVVGYSKEPPAINTGGSLLTACIT